MAEEKGKLNIRRLLGPIFLAALVIVGAFLLLGGPTADLDKSRRTEGLVMCASLATAVENFYGEYDRLPDVGASRFETEGPAGVKLLKILFGLEGDVPEIQNTRSIIFFQFAEAKDKKGGIVYEEHGFEDDSSVIGIYDPYGSPYVVILNIDESDSLEFKWGGVSIELRGKQVAVISVGKDGKEGTADDVKSWN